MADLIAVTGEPGVQKMLDEYAPGPRQNLERRAVRAGANVIKRQMAFEAETSGHPHSFAKVRVRVSTHGGAGMEVQAVVRPKSPLFNIFEPGARPHEIAPHNGALGGPAGGGAWTAEGRKRPAAFFSRKAVRHPGMRARPIEPAVMASAGRAAQDAMAAVIFGQDRGAALGSGG